MRLRVVSTAASLLAVVPGASYALGLGDIQLKSALNAPLNAEIELIATPEELASLRTQIASRDTFSRYGLDYPAFLTGIQVHPLVTADGRNVVQLTSAAPMTEPFATLLVEASWARGRNLREYTVLFDPPVFVPQQAAAAPIAAAVSGSGERSGAIARPVPAAPTPAAPRPIAAEPPRSPANGSSYSVRGGDSLSRIAQQTYGEGQSERAMIAIYRANPQAFGGNINQLRAGAVLRMPDSAAIAGVDPGEAAGEVRRQVAAWASGARPGTPANAAADARLRLIPPDSTGADGGASQALRERVSRLESELAESRRLLELRSAELARLQGASVAPAISPRQTDTPPVAQTQPTPAPAAAEPTVEPAPPAAAPQPAVVEPVAAAPATDTGPSLIDRLKALWYVPVGLLALLLAVLAARSVRRRRESSLDNISPFGVNVGDSARDVSSDTFPLRKPVVELGAASILVEESGQHERPAFARKETRTVDLEDGTGSMVAPALDATAALEQGDPLAEADFHMAYGLYDQAADLVKLAIAREPTRRDLKLKLLEVFFVWGNKDQFLQTARDLADSRDASAPGEWEKVVIMGKQIAPEDALFSQSYSGAGPTSVDLNLEGGQNLIDFDLHGEPSMSFAPDGGVDTDLGAALRDDATAGGEITGLDFILDDPARSDDAARTATTRQMAQPGFTTDTEAATQRFNLDGPTVEQPALDMDDTLLGKLDAHTPMGSPDQTAELSLDDLGLDLGSLESTDEGLLDDSLLTRALESPDAPTLVAGLDDTSRRLIEDAEDANQPTELLPLAELDALGGDGGETSRVSVLDFDLDLESSVETGKRNALVDSDFNLDLDVGSAEQLPDGEHQSTQRIDPVSSAEDDLTMRDLEPATMSEVGTKLDLARAYMDMGDPDGARSILNEVLQEGSSSQKQEAQRLIDSIPG